VAYATYPAGALTRRADVVTREIPDAKDLVAALGAAQGEGERRAILDAVACLVATLTTVGARHPDLNIKNILIAPDESDPSRAFVLDVDRIWFDVPGARRVTMRNLHRLERSARKWRRLHGLPIDESELRHLAARVDELLRPSDPSQGE
jgi:hypothetical protein